MRAFSLTIAAALLVAACARGSGSELSIRNARAFATPPGASVAAAYMDIVASDGDTLLGVTTPVAGRVEMHESREEGGVMKMRPLASVELKPGRRFSFEPGGAHLMLIGLREGLIADTEFPLTLRFRKAGEFPIGVEVFAPGARPAQP